MIPVNQFILGSSDPLLYPSEKMTNSIDEQIAFLQSQNQQVPTQGIWDAIDAEIAPLTQEQLKLVKLLKSKIVEVTYHDYAKLFEEWFGGNIDNKVFESAITFWFKDVDFDGDKVWEYFHMNN